MARTAINFHVDPEAGTDTTTALTSCIASNPSGTITRITKAGHGLNTGDAVILSLFSAWLNGSYVITKVDDDNFDLNGTAWQATADTSGTVTPTGGTTITSAWKTVASGATAARIQPGDFIKLKKSPDPVSLGIAADWTDDSSIVTLASPLTATLDMCESGWTQSANVTVTYSTTEAEGTYATQMAIASGFATGLVAYKNISPINISGYTNLTLYVKSSAILAAGVFSLQLDDTNGCGSPLESIAIPAIPTANKFYPIVIPIATPASLTSVASIGLYANSDPGAITITLDCILACNSFSLLSLIGKNTAWESYYTIKSIDGVTVTLGNCDRASKYYGYTETINPTYRRETIKNPTPGTTIHTINEAGALGSWITVSGGWDFDGDGTQNGESWYDGVSGEATGLVAADGYSFVEKIGLVRFLHGFYGSNISNPSRWDNLHAMNLSSNFMIYLGYVTYAKLSNLWSNGGIGSSYAGVQANASYGAGIFIANEIRAISATGDAGVYCNNAFFKGNNIYCTGNKYGVVMDRCEIENLHTRLNTDASVYQSQTGIMRFFNPNFSEATVFLNAQDVFNYGDTYISITKLNDTEGDDHRYTMSGEIIRQTADARSGTCAEMVPSTADTYVPLQLHIGPIPVVASELCTVTVYIKKSADFNGPDVQLSLKMNGAIVDGPDAYTATTSYVQRTLSFTPSVSGIVELLVECNGTVGSIYVDDVGHNSVESALSTWFDGIPVITQASGAASGGGFLIDGGLVR